LSWTKYIFLSSLLFFKPFSTLSYVLSTFWHECQCITTNIWEMQRVVKTFQDPQRFSCFLVTNPCSQIAVDTALRYWGCAAQAGVYVAGALYPKLATDTAPLASAIEEGFSPLRISGIPFLSFESPPDWDEVIRRMSQQTKDVLDGRSQAKPIPPPVTFDQSARTVTLFLPGFNKSDVKLSQWRGGSELLVEAGDQRRSVVLPTAMRGKVSGAKFQENCLVVTVKPR
jgi:HSP20 family molecular chaperone IbpA